MGSIVIGTIDLTGLCGCPDPCADCCGIPIDCCSGTIPQTIHLTFTTYPGSDCTCANGSFALVWDGSKWTGTGVFGTCGGNLIFSFHTNCTCDISFDYCANSFFGQGAVSVTCTPFDALFENINLDPCCGAGPISGCRFHVTL